MSIIQVFVWLLPASALKNRLLCVFGHDIASSASVGSVVALNLCHVVIGHHSVIHSLNIFRSLRLLQVGDDVVIGKLNTITAFPGFRELEPDVGHLVMENGSFITSRHYLDCSGGVRMGELSGLCGHRTTLLTHEIDMSTNQQTAGFVTIGERAAVLTNCVVLKGAVLPPLSLLAAHSTLIKAPGGELPSGFYAGTPAKYISTVSRGDSSWFDRQVSATTDLRIDYPTSRLQSRK
jgi:acetyltransferase-like isoleucine patch superfamily enzyme